MNMPETCPHCGAEKETTSPHYYNELGVSAFVCGNIMDTQNGRVMRVNPICYERQLAAKDVEIDRLRQSVLDEREACEAVAKAHVCDSRCKYACGVDKFCKVAIAQEIRARGEEK